MILTINYNGQGKMNIVCNTFFPTSKVKLKKVFNLLDGDWRNGKESVGKLIVWMEQQIRDDKYDLDTHKSIFQKKHQEMCELEHIIKDQKFPNGLPVKRDRIKQLRADLKNLKKFVKEEQFVCLRLMRKIPKLQENLEMVMNYDKNRKY